MSLIEDGAFNEFEKKRKNSVNRCTGPFYGELDGGCAFTTFLSGSFTRKRFYIHNYVLLMCVKRNSNLMSKVRVLHHKT